MHRNQTWLLRYLGGLKDIEGEKLGLILAANSPPSLTPLQLAPSPFFHVPPSPIEARPSSLRAQPFAFSSP